MNLKSKQKYYIVCREYKDKITYLQNYSYFGGYPWGSYIEVNGEFTAKLFKTKRAASLHMKPSNDYEVKLKEVFIELNFNL